MTNPSNWWNSKLFIRKSWLSNAFSEITSYKRYLTADIHLHIQLEVVDFNLL